MKFEEIILPIPHATRMTEGLSLRRFVRSLHSNLHLCDEAQEEKTFLEIRRKMGWDDHDDGSIDYAYIAWVKSSKLPILKHPIFIGAMCDDLDGVMQGDDCLKIDLEQYPLDDIFYRYPRKSEDGYLKYQIYVLNALYAHRDDPSKMDAILRSAALQQITGGRHKYYIKQTEQSVRYRDDICEQYQFDESTFQTLMLPVDLDFNIDVMQHLVNPDSYITGTIKGDSLPLVVDRLIELTQEYRPIVIRYASKRESIRLRNEWLSSPLRQKILKDYQEGQH